MRKSTTNVRQLVMAALCAALGVVLPVTTHSIPNAGSILLPMHIPVLLCGLVCGPVYGLTCGIVAPLLSSLITGMPPAAVLPSMLCELAVYGLAAGLLSKVVRTGRRVLDLYVQLIGAMLLGRVVYGVMNALVFSAGKYSFSAFVTAAFVTALPGIVIQLVLLPAVVLLLEKAHVIQTPAAAKR
ncbi:MAG: ECF transporter S component [Subdoligranulum sp.]|nr:ECF transporter S component [Subdoligranulum sp.]